MLCSCGALPSSCTFPPFPHGTIQPADFACAFLLRVLGTLRAPASCLLQHGCWALSALTQKARHRAELVAVSWATVAPVAHGSVDRHVVCVPAANAALHHCCGPVRWCLDTRYDSVVCPGGVLNSVPCLAIAYLQSRIGRMGQNCGPRTRDAEHGVVCSYCADS